MIRRLFIAISFGTMTLSGCHETGSTLQPVQVEEYNLPPQEKRYSDPSSYPEQKVPHRPAPKPSAGAGMPQGGMGGPGMGGFGP